MLEIYNDLLTIDDNWRTDGQRIAPQRHRKSVLIQLAWVIFTKICVPTAWVSSIFTDGWETTPAVILYCRVKFSGLKESHFVILSIAFLSQFLRACTKYAWVSTVYFVSYLADVSSCRLWKYTVNDGMGNNHVRCDSYHFRPWANPPVCSGEII